MIYKIYTPSKSGKNKCPGINILLNASWWGVVGVEATTSGTSLGLGECFHLATRMLLLGLWCVFLEGVGLITETGGAWVSESLNSVAPSPGYPNDWYRRGGLVPGTGGGLWCLASTGGKGDSSPQTTCVSGSPDEQVGNCAVRTTLNSPHPTALHKLNCSLWE